MATATPFLKLVLPANDEYYNVWDQPLNSNLTIIDTAIGSVTTEVVNARGSQPTLSARLATALDPAGNLQPSPEVIAARVSSVYGGFTASSIANLLNDRLEYGDREAWNARQSLSSLSAALAWDADQNKNNSIISAPTNYINPTGPKVSLNAVVSTTPGPTYLLATTPIVANINGYRQVIRTGAGSAVGTIKTVDLTGQSAGTYYLKLTYTGGSVYLTDSGIGQISLYGTNGLNAVYTSTGVSPTNFVTSGVQPGDIITITAPSGDPNIGNYIVLATNREDTTLTTSQIAIAGQFVSLTSGLTATFTNPVDPQFGFTGTAHAKTFTRVANVIYIGRCVFDGTNVTSVTPYQSLGSYAGFTSIALISGAFSVSIPHNIGYFPNRVAIYASQANDFSQPLELLSSATVTGGGSLGRSVIAKMDDLILYVKNSTSGLFYTDFNGSNQTSGYLYAVVER